MSVKCCLLHRDTVPSCRNIFRFSEFVSMSWSGSIYILWMWSIFLHHFYFHYVWSYNLINTETIFFVNFISSSQKFSISVLLSFCLIFLSISACAAYKSVAYKNACTKKPVPFFCDETFQITSIEQPAVYVMFKHNKVVIEHFIGIILFDKVIAGTTLSAPTLQILPSHQYPF